MAARRAEAVMAGMMGGVSVSGTITAPSNQMRSTGFYLNKKTIQRSGADRGITGLDTSIPAARYVTLNMVSPDPDRSDAEVVVYIRGKKRIGVWMIKGRSYTRAEIQKTVDIVTRVADKRAKSVAEHKQQAERGEDDDVVAYIFARFGKANNDFFFAVRKQQLPTNIPYTQDPLDEAGNRIQVASRYFRSVGFNDLLSDATPEGLPPAVLRFWHPIMQVDTPSATRKSVKNRAVFPCRVWDQVQSGLQRQWTPEEGALQDYLVERDPGVAPLRQRTVDIMTGPEWEDNVAENGGNAYVNRTERDVAEAEAEARGLGPPAGQPSDIDPFVQQAPMESGSIVVADENTGQAVQVAVQGKAKGSVEIGTIPLTVTKDNTPVLAQDPMRLLVLHTVTVRVDVDERGNNLRELMVNPNVYVESLVFVIKGGYNLNLAQMGQLPAQIARIEIVSEAAATETLPDLTIIADAFPRSYGIKGNFNAVDLIPMRTAGVNPTAPQVTWLQPFFVRTRLAPELGRAVGIQDSDVTRNAIAQRNVDAQNTELRQSRDVARTTRALQRRGGPLAAATAVALNNIRERRRQREMGVVTTFGERRRPDRRALALRAIASPTARVTFLPSPDEANPSNSASTARAHWRPELKKRPAGEVPQPNLGI